MSCSCAALSGMTEAAAVYNRFGPLPISLEKYAVLRIRMQQLPLLRRGKEKDHGKAAEAMPVLRQEHVHETDLGAGVSPQGFGLVRDRLQVRQGQPAQSCRRRQGRRVGQ